MLHEPLYLSVIRAETLVFLAVAKKGVLWLILFVQFTIYGDEICNNR